MERNEISLSEVVEVVIFEVSRENPLRKCPGSYAKGSRVSYCMVIYARMYSTYKKFGG